MSKSTATTTFNGRTINTYDYARHDSGNDLASVSKEAIANWLSQYLADLKSQYNLSDDDLALIKPILMSGATDSQILQYVNEITANHQSDEKNSFANQISQQRAAGFNPDLSGSAPGVSGSTVPSAAGLINSADLPSSGGKSSLSTKFTEVAGLVLKTMAFGVNTYGVVANSLMNSASLLSGFATEDSLRVLADENGVVTDVNGAINQLVASRGLKGKKAKQYASFLANRINSTADLTARLRQMSDKELAYYDYKVNKFKSGNEYIDEVTSFLLNTQKTQTKMAEYDMRVAETKLEWLKEHPDVPAEELELALRGKRAETSEAEFNATDAANKAAISGEQLKQEKSNTGVVIKENEVKQLQANLRKIELEGIDEMISFCKEWENQMSMRGIPKYAWFTGQDYDVYKAYKRAIREYYDKGKTKGKVSVSVPGAGSLSFGN